GEDGDLDVATEYAPRPQVDREQPGRVGGPEPGADRPEDRSAHARGGRDERQEARELAQGAGEMREGQAGDEAGGRAEDERDQALADGPRLGPPVAEEPLGAACEG